MPDAMTCGMTEGRGLTRHEHEIAENEKMMTRQTINGRDEGEWLSENGLIVDLFAGGGGASVAIEEATGRPVSIALNHDPMAVALHGVNHPRTRHFCQDIETAVPIEITGGKPVYLLWASPSCTQHSRAKAARPAEQQLREMGWKVIDWTRDTRPLIVACENVGEWVKWGPLGRDGRPDKTRLGETWRRFVQAFRDLGYRVEWQEVNAAEHGAPTARRRLFLVARRDYRPIRWPNPTHGPRGGSPYLQTCDYIDWSIPAPSIFGRDKDLVPATMTRIFKGLKKLVLDDPDPFFVPEGVTVAGGGHADAVAAFLAQNNTGVIGQRIDAPISTLTATCSQQSVVLAFMDKLRNNATGVSMREPIHTLCAQGDHFAEVRVAAYGLKYYSEGGQLQDLREPLGTITTKDRFAIVMVRGEPHVITDIGYRFLQPHELWRLQGFPSDYRTNVTARGKPMGATHQKRMIGNSVSPPAGVAVLRANLIYPHADELPLAA